MRGRQQTWGMTHGYVVMSVPESGLYAHDGEIFTGDGQMVKTFELILFKRRSDAEDHATKTAKRWKDGDKRGQEWKFPIVPVLVNERL